ncbi:MAG: hypothetical protein JWM88_2485, partial [Verrucomicrobia bacterium]|nr:hypothetical protein [Verrucomicrobiota bacterium]
MFFPALRSFFFALAPILPAVLYGQSNYATPYVFTTLAGQAGGAVDGLGSAARFSFPFDTA